MRRGLLLCLSDCVSISCAHSDCMYAHSHIHPVHTLVVGTSQRHLPQRPQTGSGSIPASTFAHRNNDAFASLIPLQCIVTRRGHINRPTQPIGSCFSRTLVTCSKPLGCGAISLLS